MAFAIILILIFIVTGWAIFRKPSPAEKREGVPSYVSSPDNLAEPVISYSLYALDMRSGHRLEMQSPHEFQNQFGIVNGQAIELHWNVLNADWISIEGVGFVQAIGKKEFYPFKNTKYKIVAKNRKHSIEQDFFVRVFPVPVIEKLLIPVPALTPMNIELFRSAIPAIEKFIPIQFPSFQLPSVILIQKANMAGHPEVLSLDKTMVSRMKQENNGKEFYAIKTKLFNNMEKVFRDNYKVRDVLKTIRKHYE